MLIADRSGIISDHFDPRVIGVNVSFRWFWPCYVAVPSIVKRCCVIHRNCLVPAYHLRPTPDIRMYPQYLGGRWTVGNMWNGFWSRSAHNQRWEFPSSHRQFPILLCKFLQLKWLYLSPSPPRLQLVSIQIFNSNSTNETIFYCSSKSKRLLLWELQLQ